MQLQSWAQCWAQGKRQSWVWTAENRCSEDPLLTSRQVNNVAGQKLTTPTHTTVGFYLHWLGKELLLTFQPTVIDSWAPPVWQSNKLGGSYKSIGLKLVLWELTGRLAKIVHKSQMEDTVSLQMLALAKEDQRGLKGHEGFELGHFFCLFVLVVLLLRTASYSWSWPQTCYVPKDDPEYQVLVPLPHMC